MHTKKGLSAVVATVLLVGLAVILVGILWGVISNLVQTKLEETHCLDAIGKITFNDLYTCHNRTTGNFQFSINVDDIDLERATVSIYVQGERKSLEITSVNTTVANLKLYNKVYSEVILPIRGGGLTYLYNLTAAGFSNAPDRVEIAPVLGGDQCDTSDSILEIPYCSGG